MKHRLQITLEDNAVAILNQQENKSQFIEDLIVNRESNDLATEIRRLATLVDGLISSIKQPIVAPTVPAAAPESTKRGKMDILADIRTTEAEYAERAEYCQDPQTLKELKSACEAEIGSLWAEYKELENA